MHKKLYLFIGAIVLVAVLIWGVNALAPRDIDPASYGPFARGLQYMKKGDYESAIIAFTLVVKKNPDSSSPPG